MLEEKAKALLLHSLRMEAMRMETSGEHLLRWRSALR